MASASYQIKLCLSIDIGGTLTSYGLFSISSSLSICPKPIWSGSQPTSLGKKKLSQSIAQIYNLSKETAFKYNYSLLPHIVIGCPGHFVSNKIMPGSADNLAITPGEFDNVYLNDLFLNNLPIGIDLTIGNDAKAQMLGGYLQLSKTHSIRKQLLNQKIGYIGSGTGLGGGFGKINHHGKLIPITDGHISHFLLKTNPSSTPSVLQRAEQLISGRSFEINTGVSPRTFTQDPRLFDHHQPMIESMGYYLGQLAYRIYLGDIQQAKKNKWSPSDIQKVKGTRHFLLGGSLGTVDPIASILQTKAEHYLSNQGLKLTFFRIPNSTEAALLGATEWLPFQYRQ